MKNRIITNSLRSIKNSFSRFIPLLIMSFLGVFVYAGLNATKPDMINALDNFLDSHNVYDLKIISTLGLTKDDRDALNKIKGVKNAEYSYSKDVLINDNDEELVINIASLPNNINTLKLVKGRLPNAKNEIVLENNFITKTSYKIGDTLVVKDNDVNEENFIIVGTVESGLYFNNVRLNQDRGTTTIGSGTINYYAYVLEDNFKMDYYNAIYVTVANAKEMITNDKEYQDLINKYEEKIENIKSKQEDNRYQSLYNELNDEIEKNEKEANNNFTQAKKELDKAQSKLTKTKKELDTAKTNLNDYKNKLDKAKIEITNNENALNKVFQDNNITKETLNDTIKLLDEQIKNLELVIKELDQNSKTYQEYNLKLTNLKNNYNTLNELKIKNDAINTAKDEYQTNLASYNTLNNQYEKGLKEYNSGLKEYNDSLSKYKKEKQNAEEKIKDAKDELNNLEKPTWYINTRLDYQTYGDYIDDVLSIANLSKIFPLVFFAVAILVSLISMNRLVEDDRIEIGTLKSLGFKNKEIIIKYILFASLAVIIGGIIGGILGVIIIPSIISSIYNMLFNVPNFKIYYNFKIILLSMLIAIICIGGSTIYTVLKVIKEKPADLMRPKAPKNGKRVLLEKISFIWNHLSFSNKITVRNLMRYKKRGIVTIIGIAGCSALLLCGFGIRDAIIDIGNMQYQETFKFNAMVYLNGDIKKDTFSNSNITAIVPSENIKVKQNKISANLFVVNKDEIEKIVNLKDKNKQKLKLEKDKVIITDKFADLNNLHIGDKVNLLDDNNNVYSYEISGITKNYLMHYIYLDEDTFSKKYEYKPNVVYLNTKDISSSKRENLATEIRNNDEVLSITFMEDLVKSADNMLKSLNKVVLIILVLAASLSFVVLYNLSSININERKREISTLKVLGFHDHEVDHYITKENIIFTIFGIIIGLILGYFLTNFVIVTVEIEKARFIHHISIYSYLYTIIITFIFTFLVNFVTHFNLKKIDMIASLKSVD